MSHPSWLDNLLLLFGGGAIGAFLVALVKKPWTMVEKNLLHATASKEKAVGQADMLQAMASTFTGVTSGLREEIERLQGDASEMRQRAIQFELELKAALQRVDDLERIIDEKDTIIGRLKTDLDRALGQIACKDDRILQQEGEIRQLQNLLESKKRIEG